MSAEGVAKELHDTYWRLYPREPLRGGAILLPWGEAPETYRTFWTQVVHDMMARGVIDEQVHGAPLR